MTAAAHTSNGARGVAENEVEVIHSFGYQRPHPHHRKSADREIVTNCATGADGGTLLDQRRQGLLIGFGVLIGSLLYATGAFGSMVRALLKAVAAGKLPYAMAVAMSTIFPSIYVDVQVVLASPVARSTAPHIWQVNLSRRSVRHRRVLCRGR